MKKSNIKSINFDQKKHLAERLQNLDQFQLTKTIQYIRQRIPRAVMEIDKENYKLVLDYIPET